MHCFPFVILMAGMSQVPPILMPPFRHPFLSAVFITLEVFKGQKLDVMPTESNLINAKCKSLVYVVATTFCRFYESVDGLKKVHAKNHRLLWTA